MARKELKFFSNLIFLVFIGLFLLSVSNVEADGAILYFAPASGTYVIGNNFSVAVKVDSGGQLVNAIDGIITFDNAKLEVVSISKSNSMLGLWVQEPVFSNSNGTISFAGGKPGVGYMGSAGEIVTIVFKPKILGQVNVSFSSGSVLADDGFGTNVLASMSSANYNFVESEPPRPVPPPVGVPSAPEIFSSTHPVEENWYSNNDPHFFWEISDDIRGVRYLATRQPVSFPSYYIDPGTEAQLTDIPEGTWYFHLRLRNRFGWGEISHFKFQIDTVPPEYFTAVVKEGDETTSPTPTLIFDTTDETSGVDYYEIRVDKEDPIKIKETEYKLQPQGFGKHIIIVKAVDRAGNEMVSVKEVNILAIEAPKITEYPRELISGSTLLIKGTAIPEATVDLYIERNEAVEITQTNSDNQGNWLYIHETPLEKGVYDIYAEAVNKDGARSQSSETVVVNVTPPAFIRIGKIVIDYLLILLILLVLLAIIIIFLIWLLGLIRRKKKKLVKETEESKSALYKAFKFLRDKIREQIANLDREPDLNQREQEIYNNLEKTLDVSEQMVEKEIKDIEEELK